MARFDCITFKREEFDAMFNPPWLGRHIVFDGIDWKVVEILGEVVILEAEV